MPAKYTTQLQGDVLIGECIFVPGCVTTKDHGFMSGPVIAATPGHGQVQNDYLGGCLGSANKVTDSWGRKLVKTLNLCGGEEQRILKISQSQRLNHPDRCVY